MSARLLEILEAAGLTDAASLTIRRSSAAGDAIAPSGVLVLMIDDDGASVAEVLRRYPSEHPLRVADASLEIRRSTVGAAQANLGDNCVALIVDPLPLFELRQATDGLRGVIDRLRDPVDGCPWDNEQTHLSLRPHLLEETYEVLEAIGDGDPGHLCEELGDLLMQVVLHAKLAEQEGQFTLDDVAEGIRAKLVRRHPHVFGDASADSAQWVESAWERLKARERPNRKSVLDGVPQTLPALARAQSLLGRAQRNGFPRSPSAGAELGERALDLVLEAREAGVNLEDAVGDALGAFERRVRGLESEFRAEGRAVSEIEPEELRRRWEATIGD